MKYRKMMIAVLIAIIVLISFLLAFFGWKVISENGDTDGRGESQHIGITPSVEKKPEEYTYDEFEAMTPEEQESFFEKFDSAEDFENWQNEAQYEQIAKDNPWEAEDARKPNEYTIEEFNALTPEQQEMFFNWFGSAEDFEKWKNDAEGADIVNVSWPKKPDKYTWEEFNALSAEEQELFFDWFDSAEAFEEWQNKAQSENNFEVNWEKDGEKKPNEYTWEEFNALTPEQQELFFEEFDSAEDFEKWKIDAEYDYAMRNVPWGKNGAKKPDKYTYEEFDALTPEEQELFFEWFDSAADFERWMNRVKP